MLVFTPLARQPQPGASWLACSLLCNTINKSQNFKTAIFHNLFMILVHFRMFLLNSYMPRECDVFNLKSALILDHVLEIITALHLHNKSLVLEFVLYCDMFDVSILKRDAPYDNMKHFCVFL